MNPDTFVIKNDSELNAILDSVKEYLTNKGGNGKINHIKFLRSFYSSGLWEAKTAYELLSMDDVIINNVRVALGLSSPPNVGNVFGDMQQQVKENTIKKDLWKTLIESLLRSLENKDIKNTDIDPYVLYPATVGHLIMWVYANIY